MHLEDKDERKMGMEPSKLKYLQAISWGSKAALKKLSFAWFGSAFDGFKIGLKHIFVKIRFL